MTFQTNFFQISQNLIEEINLKYHKSLILDHLLLLDEESRNNRFCGNVGNSFIQKYVDSLDKKRGDRLYGILQRGLEPTAYHVFPQISHFSPQIIILQIKLSIIGLSHISIYSHNGTNSAELALSVSDSYRKKGLGSKLVEDAILHRARELEIEEISCQCLYTNRKVQELLKRGGSQISQDIFSNSSHGKAKIPPKDLDYLFKRATLTPIEIASMIGNRSFI